jgi:hypothetical protein
MLTDFSTNANVVRHSFESYNAAVQGFRSDVQRDRRDAAAQLQHVLTADADQVSTALRNIQDLFAPPLSSQKSLLDFHLDLMTDQLKAYAANGDHCRVARPLRADEFWNANHGMVRRWSPVANDDGIFAYEEVWKHTHEFVNTAFSRLVDELLVPSPPYNCRACCY